MIPTPIEYGVAFTALVLVILCGTHGSHIGTAVALVGAWHRDPVLVAVGLLFAWFTMPQSEGPGGGGGRSKHA